MRSVVRENARVIFLVTAVLLSLFFLFGPIGPSGGTGGDGNASAPGSAFANLQYGLELAGGTRIRAPLVGWHASDLQYSGDNPTQVSQTVADELQGVESQDVEMIASGDQNQVTWTLEVQAKASRSAVADAFAEAGFPDADVQPGVSAQTREQTVRVLQDKIDETGLQGGSVTTSYSVSDGRNYVVVEVPNANQSEVEELVSDTGRVEIRAYHSVEENGTTRWVNRTTLTNDDLSNPGLPRQTAQGPGVGVTVRDTAAERFQQDMVETGIAAPQGSSCGWPGADRVSEPSGPCILIVRVENDSETVIGSFGMEGRGPRGQPGLANSMISGEWANDPQFRLPTETMDQARDLSVNLRAGELPTRLELENGTAQFVSPTFGQSARMNAVIAAIVAVLAVSTVVGVRYGNIRVAVPMVLTALSEVVLLLGFASIVGMALDLSHIAGFIAVIGTGVDDLVIIADEILQQGKVATGRVFQNRFRKAFWVIGAAAATTIIAMSPLTVLSLGDLTGFAIITIVGVLLGVLVTRPAYGDILRNLMLGEDESVREL